MIASLGHLKALCLDVTLNALNKAYYKIKKQNLLLINNDTHQRETLSERPIRPPLSFNDGHPPEGRGFWKLNCNYLHHDSDFIMLVKNTIHDFKEAHKNSDCNPNIIWDSLKCTIAGVCIEYSVRKRRERNGIKAKLMGEIEKVKIQMNDDPSNESLISQLDSLNVDLNKILDFETKGLMIRSRTRWMEEGERSSKYFCNLEKRSCEKKCI